MFRTFAFAATLAALPVLSAQVTLYDTPTPGYVKTQTELPAPNPTWGSAGGLAYAPTGGGLYYYEAQNQAVVHDNLSGTVSTVYTFPTATNFRWVDDFEFDNQNPLDFYAVDSTDQVIHKFRLSNPTTLDTSFASSGVLTGSALTTFPYDLAHDPSGRLFLAHGEYSTRTSLIAVVDAATLAVTDVIDIGGVNGQEAAGPIAFDAAGNMYVGLTPDFGTGDPWQLIKFSKTKIDDAFANSTVLGLSDAVTIIGPTKGYKNIGRFIVRTEGGKEMLYGVDSDGDLIKFDLVARVRHALASQASYATGFAAFPGAIAADSLVSNLYPYSGDTARVTVMTNYRDASWNVVQISLTTFQADAAPTGVDSLAISAQAAGAYIGYAFGATVELRDTSGFLYTAEEGSIEASIISGPGSLTGTTMASTTGGIAQFNNLRVEGATGTVVLQFKLVGTATTVNASAMSINGFSVAGGGDDSSSGCASAGGAGWPLAGLLLLLGIFAVARRKRELV